MKKRWAILRWACTVAAVLSIAASLYSTKNHVHLQVAGLLAYLLEGRVETYWPLPDRSFDAWVFPGDLTAKWWFAAGRTSGVWGVAVPLWFPTLATAIPAFVLWRTHLRLRREARRGICPACNYPLTGLAPGSPCPECGDGKRGGETKA